jgi:hypothetical protein
MRVLTLILFMAITVVACKKVAAPDSVFPTETTEGKNTFGAYVDGVPFIASTTLFGQVRPVNAMYEPGPNGYFPSGFLNINGIDARYGQEQAGSITIQKQGVFSTGEYPLSNDRNCTDYNLCDLGGYDRSSVPRVYFVASGTLTITRLDTLQKIIAGRFSFVAVDTLGNRRQVTGGVFDIRYGY